MRGRLGNKARLQHILESIIEVESYLVGVKLQHQVSSFSPSHEPSFAPQGVHRIHQGSANGPIADSDQRDQHGGSY